MKIDNRMNLIRRTVIKCSEEHGPKKLPNDMREVRVNVEREANNKTDALIQLYIYEDDHLCNC